MAVRLTRSQIMQRQLHSQAKENLKSLVSFFNAGDFKSTLKMGQELISLASGLRDPHRYLVEANHYLALIHVYAKRHDRAVNNVSQMIFTAKTSGNSRFFTKSLVTLGIVHLSFGHLDAVCRAWELLFCHLEDLVPKAWLLHEMGRCHFESERYSKALKLALRCQKTAEEANSKKWILHGKLLSGQSLLKLGRFGEALEALKVSEIITEEEGDTLILSYIQDLVSQVSEILRQSMLNFSSEESILKYKGSSDITFLEEVDAPLNGEVSYTERKVLKDYEAFRWDTLERKMLLKKPTSEISSRNSEEKETLLSESGKDHSITARTFVLKTDFDLDTFRSRNSDSTCVIQSKRMLSPRTFQNQDDVDFEVSEIGDSQVMDLLRESLEIEKQSKNLKLSKLEMECESKVLRTLSEIGEDVSRCQILKERSEEEVCLSMELLSKDLDEKIKMNAGLELRNEESKSPEKCIEVDTDWRRLEFVGNHEVQDLTDATESIQTGRSYNFVTTHALCPDSIPSSPQRENAIQETHTCIESTTNPDPF